MGEQLTRSDYRMLLGIARRHARNPADAEDVVQDALLAALVAQREIAAPGRAWLAGTIRNMALTRARSAARRHRREERYGEGRDTYQEPCRRSMPELGGLPRSLRIVAILALSGHTRAEIRFLLRISDESLRQRICGLRRRVAGWEEGVHDMPLLSEALDLGSIRRSLLPLARSGKIAFASHDPDGHPMAFKIALPASHKTSSGGI